jgi:plasmid stabilization system protein ParE
MRRRYALSPQAALDLAEIWHYIKNQSRSVLADRVESTIRDRIVFLAKQPRHRSLAQRYN